MFCSAVIPTINRPTLTRAVCSILNQDFHTEEFEIIVVNDSGQPLPQMDWQNSDCVHIISTQRRERSVARNTGAAIARGRYLYFLDDDDIMLPGAMQAFWDLARVSDFPWLYGGYQTVDNQGNLLEEFHPDLKGNVSAYLIAGEAIPFQTSFIRADMFYTAGEFDVYFTGAQDRDLGRRIALRGKVANTQALIAQIRVGQNKSSTNWSKLAEFDRLGREKALDQPNAHLSLWDSAKSSSYLIGRVTRAYLASAVWNFKQMHPLKVTSRLFFMVIFGLPHVLSSDFWKGLRTRLPRLGEFKTRNEPNYNEIFPIGIIITILVTCISSMKLWNKFILRNKD